MPGRSPTPLAGLLSLLPLLVLAGAAAASPADTARPRPPGGGPTPVSAFVWLADLHDIDSSGQTFTANVFVTLRWKDPRLAHGGTDPERYALEDVWNPRVAIANEVGDVQRTMPADVEVQPDGSVTARQRYLGRFSQVLRVDDFPFDRHTFRLHLVSAGYSPGEIGFVADPRWVQAGLKGAGGIADETAIPDWEIDGWRTYALPYPIVKTVEAAGWAFEFDARRKSGYYVWKVILPLVLIIGISWSVFWIDPENAGTEVGVATTSMLTLIAYRFAVDTQVPRVPYLTRLDLFISGSTVLVFLTLVEVVLVIRMARHGGPAAARRTDLVSRVVFPLVFVVFSLWALVW